VADAYPSAVSELSAAELLSLVQSLPSGFRAVFNLYAIEGYSHKEIAGKLGIEESTSRSQFTRAKQLLKNKIVDIRKNEDRRKG
jgi:RNA polymerase sigma-70 factor (ECF subfamily)